MPKTRFAVKRGRASAVTRSSNSAEPSTSSVTSPVLLPRRYTKRSRTSVTVNPPGELTLSNIKEMFDEEFSRRFETIKAGPSGACSGEFNERISNADDVDSESFQPSRRIAWNVNSRSRGSPRLDYPGTRVGHSEDKGSRSPSASYNARPRRERVFGGRSAVGCNGSGFRQDSSDPEEEDYNHALEVLMQSAGASFGGKKGKKNILPHNFVIRDDKKCKVGVGESKWAEYFSALFRMCSHRDVPSDWVPHIRLHQEQLAIMAVDWEWETCLTWSERIFDMIDDGRLKMGWSDLYAIKDVQRDVCAVATRLAVIKKYTAKSDFSDNSSYRSVYSKEADGVPCPEWNEGKQCGFPVSHGHLPDRFAHVCNWCATRYKRANGHREIECNNKRRTLSRGTEDGGDKKSSFNKEKDF